MPEVRVDPLTGLKTIVAADRASRPGGGLLRGRPPIDPERDPFLEATRTRRRPRSTRCAPTGRPRHAGLAVRVVPNLYPALTPARRSRRPRQPRPLHAPAARGAHEVIVNAPDPVTSLAELRSSRSRRDGGVARAHARARRRAAYVHLIVNERREAGASLPHTHAQLYALDFVPAARRPRARALRRLRRRARWAATCSPTSCRRRSRRRERIVAIDDEAVLMAPYGARLPFQLMLAPRRPRARFEDDGPPAPRCCTTRCAACARRLGASPPLNLWVRTAPRGAEHFCWRIDVLPRLTHLAGLELGTGVHLNIVAPEQAAAELRDGCEGARAARRRAPRVRVGRRGSSARSAPGCSCCSASRTATTRRRATGSPTRSRRCGSSRTPTGR